MTDRLPDYAELPSGLIVPTDYAVQRLRRPTGFDAFCGCGGFSLGFIQAGIHVVGAIDNDPWAALTYMTNLCRYGEFRLVFVDWDAEERFEKALTTMWRRDGLEVDKLHDIAEFDGVVGEVACAGSGWISTQPRSTPSVDTFIFGDITKTTGQQLARWCGFDVGEIDCLCGGPPCQGFSTSGKQDVMDPRNELTFEFFRIGVEMRPKSIVMENVPAIQNMTTPDGRPILDVVTEILEDGDYNRTEVMRKSLMAQFGDSLVISRGKPKRRRRSKARKAEAPADQLGLDLEAERA